jgi:hypothetical protein
VIGGTGGVKAGLPTTEEGYTCWYENRDCWDFIRGSATWAVIQAAQQLALLKKR